MTDPRIQAIMEEIPRCQCLTYDEMAIRLLKAVDAVMTKEQVIRNAHEFGMHKPYVPDDCELCFNESLESYVNICKEMMVAIDRGDQADAIETFVRELASADIEGTSYPFIMFHHFPEALIYEFLGIENHDPEYDVIMEKTKPIWMKDQ